MIQNHLTKIVKNKEHSLSIDERLCLYNEGKYDKLLDAYSLLIRKYAYKYTLVKGDNIDDIYQEGLLGAWNGINKFNKDKSSALPTYIIKSAKNAMHSYVNDSKDKSIIKVEYDDVMIGSNDTIIDYDDLYFALNKLNKQDKELLREYYFNNKTLRELSFNSDDLITAETVRLRLKKVIIKVQKITKKYKLNL